MKGARLSLVALTSMAVAACVLPASQYDTGFDAPSTAAPTIRVENRYFEDMTIYLVNAGYSARLGAVQGQTSASLTIPKQLVGLGPVRLRAVPIGPGRGYTSDPLSIPMGSHLELLLERDLRFSTFSVW